MQSTLENRLCGWSPETVDARPRVMISALKFSSAIDQDRIKEVAEILQSEGQKYPVVCAADGGIIAGEELVAAAAHSGWSTIWAVEREITPEVLRCAWQEERTGLFLSIAPMAGRNQWAIKVVPTRERSEVICEDGPGPWEEVALQSFRRAESSFMRRRPLSMEQLAAGEKLRKLRESIPLSQKEAGQIADLSQNYISELENGKYSIDRIQFAIDKLNRYRAMFGAA